MTPAERARANAIPCELILYAYRKNKDGVVVSFVVHPDGVPAELAVAPIGSRWVGALVHVGDDELPVQKEAAAKPRQNSPKPDGAKRMDWRDVQPAAQAGIRCNDATFRAFLMEEHSFRPRSGEDEVGQAVSFLHSFFGIYSRSELSADHRKRVLWHQLDSQFQAWQAKERVGA